MATVHVVLFTCGGKTVKGTEMPVPKSIPAYVDTMASSATSAKASINSGSDWKNAFWSITVSGGNVYARFGTDPTAVTEEGWLILDGQTREFAVSAASETVAIKDA